ncbi:Long-chain fatty acid transport protein [Poseidonocella pacifica]|uniref:Long-chain fatty acid transport protein n=1 Tax=Poseidonocella pacifica TaxID=871651 RepID=A0A1I0VMN4_9RHOB|nr:outer membrane protein transport protein [Poseidonocella pacifica]SFA77257.1 Long-chain fatty acid transport protein [Poseidonocella pacifica]
MKKLVVSGIAIVASAGSALAGGVDRSGQSVALIFEEGNYAQLSFGSVSPDVSGVQTAATVFPTAPEGAKSGNMTNDYTQFSLGVKQSYGNGFEAAVIFDQPFGADVEYPSGEYFASDSTAELTSSAVTGIVKYTAPNNVSVFGGLRYQRFSAEAAIPFITAPFGLLAGQEYQADGGEDEGVGYLVGVAYERPDIALRVALTYNSAIDHELETTENSSLGLGRTSTTDVTTPQSINLEFQSGIAADTLVFGSIRWVDWSEFEIAPEDYDGLLDLLTGADDYSLVSYEDDTITYSLGLGRKFSENWAGAVTVAHEPAHGGTSSNLGPTDGRSSVGLAATYTMDNVKITGGVTYAWIGDTETNSPGNQPGTEFEDNHAVGYGLRIGYTF